MTVASPLLVGLIGRKRVGKDSFAAVLVEEFGFTRVAFADPLREAALALDPLVGKVTLPGALAPLYDVRLSEAIDALGWERAKDFVPEVRTILQRLGTESIRAIDPTFWIRAALAKIDAVPTPVVVTDVRYPNEADAIRARGGVLLRIVRPVDVPSGRLAEHASESALDTYEADALVWNGGTLDDLRAEARTMFA